MRSPEHKNIRYIHRNGRNYDNNESTRYMSQEAFTVLPPDGREPPPDPPMAPQPYR